jgi:hypothetical protein
MIPEALKLYHATALRVFCVSLNKEFRQVRYNDGTTIASDRHYGICMLYLSSCLNVGKLKKWPDRQSQGQPKERYGAMQRNTITEERTN